MIETGYPNSVLAEIPPKDGTHGTSTGEPKTPDNANLKNPLSTGSTYSTAPSPIVFPLAPFSFSKPLDQQLRDLYSEWADELSLINWDIDTPLNDQVYNGFVVDRKSTNSDGTRNILWDKGTPIPLQNEFNDAMRHKPLNKPLNAQPTDKSPENPPGSPGNTPSPPVDREPPNQSPPSTENPPPTIPPINPSINNGNSPGLPP